MYNHRNPTSKTVEDCKGALGKRVVLALTGTINEHRDGPSGPFVLFQPDERWGFGDTRLGVDLDVFDDSVVLPKELVLRILETLRLTYIYALKDSHPDELGDDFKPHKWEGYEVEFAQKASAQHLEALGLVYEQVMGEPRPSKGARKGATEWRNR